MIQLSLACLAAYGVILFLVGLWSWRAFAWISYTAIFGLLIAIFWQFHHMSQPNHAAHATAGDAAVPLVALAALVALCTATLIAGVCAHRLRRSAAPKAKSQGTGSEG